MGKTAGVGGGTRAGRSRALGTSYGGRKLVAEVAARQLKAGDTFTRRLSEKETTAMGGLGMADYKVTSVGPRYVTARGLYIDNTLAARDKKIPTNEIVFTHS